MELLFKLDLFQFVSEETKQKINQLNKEVVNYRVNELIHRNGDLINRIGILISGSLKATNYSREGKEVDTFYFFSVDCFPMYLIYGGQNYYPYNVYSFKRSKIIWFDRHKFLSIVESDPQLLKNVLCMISNYTCYNKLLLGASQYYKVSQRLAYWLLESYSSGKEYVEIPSSQEVLSNLLMVNRSSLNQELKKLEKSGLIYVDHRKIYIEDFESLNLLL